MKLVASNALLVGAALLFGTSTLANDHWPRLSPFVNCELITNTRRCEITRGCDWSFRFNRCVSSDSGEWSNPSSFRCDMLTSPWKCEMKQGCEWSEPLNRCMQKNS